MGVSKTGMASLLLGVVILALAWLFYFSAKGVMALVLTTVMGGVVLLGLFFALVGLLMIAI